MKTNKIIAVYGIWVAIVAILFLMTSCSPKPDNEISEMAEKCFKSRQGIIIRFEPQPENKTPQEIK